MSEMAGARTSRLEASLFASMFFALAVGMVYLGARSWMPDLASRHGAGIDRMMIYLLVSTGAMAIAGHVILGWLIWKFAHRDRVTSRMASAKAERVGSIIPAIVMAIVAEGGVLVIGLPVWTEYFVSSAPADAVTVEITAKQFEWGVRYPGADGAFGRTDLALLEPTNMLGLDRTDRAAQDDIVRVNRIYLPVNRPARIILRARDVIHSFFLPHFRVKQDVVPGMTIEIWFVPTELGEYELACTELCGLAHYRMRGTLEVLPPDEFERWLVEAAAEEEY